MTTWNYGDKPAGSSVNFNNRTYQVRKDAGQTVYDGSAKGSGDLSAMQNQLDKLRDDFNNLDPRIGGNFGHVEFDGPTNTLYGYHKWTGSKTGTVQTDYVSDVLTMSDGSRPSGAIVYAHVVNLNDSTFEAGELKHSSIRYYVEGNTTMPTCFTSARSGPEQTVVDDGSGKIATGTITAGYGTATENIGFRPSKLEIWIYEDVGRQTRKLYILRPMTDGTIYAQIYTVGGGDRAIRVHDMYQSDIPITLTDTGFQIERNVTRVYDYIAYSSSHETSGTSTTNNNKTSCPGTQMIVPVHSDGKIRLKPFINKLRSTATPADCYMEIFIQGLIGGGENIPESKYQALADRIVALENKPTDTTDLSAYATRADLSDYAKRADLGNYAKRSELPSELLFTGREWSDRISNNYGIQYFIHDSKDLTKGAVWDASKLTINQSVQIDLSVRLNNINYKNLAPDENDFFGNWVRLRSPAASAGYGNDTMGGAGIRGGAGHQATWNASVILQRVAYNPDPYNTPYRLHTPHTSHSEMSGSAHTVMFGEEKLNFHDAETLLGYRITSNGKFYALIPAPEQYLLNIWGDGRSASGKPYYTITARLTYL